MEGAWEKRAIAVGHLAITVPAIAVILLVPFVETRAFGPHLLLYYLLAGFTVAWQWQLAVLPRWEQRLVEKGIPFGEVDSLAHRAGLTWPMSAAIGSFALHTTAAAICGIHLGPWLLSRWYAWIMPLLGLSSHNPTGDDFLRHFELVSIVPAFFVGYWVAKRFARLATYAWVLPAVILAYELLMFVEPAGSVLAPHSSTRFEYFFVIQRTVPTFSNVAFGRVDPVRVARQMFAVAPFYSGLAYSAGALVATHNLLREILPHPPVETQSETNEAEDSEASFPDESEKPAHELD